MIQHHAFDTGRRQAADAPTHGRPWHRPGAAGYALTRIRGAAKPPVEVYEPEPGSVVVENDAEIVSRDGTILRANVYRPTGDGPFPVLLCAHPYGKDNLPARKRSGKGYSLPLQYKVLRQSGPIRFSSLTGWEAPDPAFWTAQGYVVVNADLRGCGTSDGVGSPFADQEGEDVYDLVEWAGQQAWSTGRVAMIGVSYLAISQWKAAALKPPHLAAMVPWEGFTDAYRELFRPGGIQETGFVKMWSKGVKNNRLAYDMGAQNTAHPLRDEFWQSLVPDLASIEVPALICGSFSDNNLHSRGSIRAFESIGSAERHMYTHRSGKWATFYSPEAQKAQVDFLAAHLKNDATAEKLPSVRLEVRDRGDHITEVRNETQWPLADTAWTPLFLTDRGLSPSPTTDSGSTTFNPAKGGVELGITLSEDVELTGPMALRLFVSVEAADDVDLFVGVEKWDGARYIPFEGSYGFGRDRVATGWMRASMRHLDESLSSPHSPVPSYDRSEILVGGELVQLDIPLGPSATQYRAGEQLRLVVAGRWMWPTNPLTGAMPAKYISTSTGRCTIHWDNEHRSRLLVPVIEH